MAKNKIPLFCVQALWCSEKKNFRFELPVIANTYNDAETKARNAVHSLVGECDNLEISTIARVSE